MAMGKQIGKGGVNLTVEADPERLKPPGSGNTPKGKVVLHLANTIPADMFVSINNLFSRNKAIATANMVTMPPVPLPKRQSTWTSRPTANKQVPVGEWSVNAQATSGDYTRLIVECDIRDDMHTRVDFGDPNVDVTVE